MQGFPSIDPSATEPYNPAGVPANLAIRYYDPNENYWDWFIPA